MAGKSAISSVYQYSRELKQYIYMRVTCVRLRGFGHWVTRGDVSDKLLTQNKSDFSSLSLSSSPVAMATDIVDAYTSTRVQRRYSGVCMCVCMYVSV